MSATRVTRTWATIAADVTGATLYQANLHVHLQVRPGSDRAARAAVMQAWYRAQLHAVVPKHIAKWESRLGARAELNALPLGV